MVRVRAGPAGPQRASGDRGNVGRRPLAVPLNPGGGKGEKKERKEKRRGAPSGWWSRPAPHTNPRAAPAGSCQNRTEARCWGAASAGWQGGERARRRGRRPQTSGPLSPVHPRSRWRGRGARGAGLTAAAREAERREGGAARGGHPPRTRPPPAPPRDSDSHGGTGTDAPRRTRESIAARSQVRAAPRAGLAVRARR